MSPLRGFAEREAASHRSAGAGAVCGDADFIRALVDLQVGPVMLTGPTMDAKVASELSLRLAHLGLRMAEHSRRAAAYAHRLQQVPEPAHAAHPQAALHGGSTKSRSLGLYQPGLCA